MAKELEALLPKHAAGLILSHNEHKNYYESVAEHLLGENSGEWSSEEARLRAIETDELWELQWYPDTPVGYHRLFAPTLSELLAFASEKEHFISSFHR